MQHQQTVPSHLRVGFRETPLAVEGGPRFAWRCETDRPGSRQASYRIVLSDDRSAIENAEGTVWDSGRVDSSRAVDVRYDGPPLSPGETYHWRVRIRNEAGEMTPYSEPATFRTAPDALDGEWISHQPGSGDVQGYRSRWRRRDEETRDWVQIDLGERRDVDAVTLVPAAPFAGFETPDGLTVSPMFARGLENASVTNPSGRVDGFGFPKAVAVEVSDEPSFDDPAGGTTVEAIENPGSDSRTIDIGERGRYVRVTALEPYTLDPSESQKKLDLVRETYEPWSVFALADVSVHADGENVAEGCPTRASSSVEADTWGVDALTDGRGSEMASSSPRLRRRVRLDKPIARAHLHVAGLGYADVHVNGTAVGDDVLNPAWTQFDERVLYETYDVTDELARGENVLGIWLGRGWFAKSFYDWTGFGSPRAIGDLRVEFDDGTTRTVSTGPGWEASDSPIVENDVYDGERYDARSFDEDWATPDHDDAWSDATVVSGPGGALRPQAVEPERVVETVEPAEIRPHSDGPIVDFGQNFTGWVELAIDDPEPGQEVVLRHAETLTEDGDLSTVDLRTADATDTYIARGDDREVYEPRFTYHGFRYAQVKNYPGALTTDDLTAKVVHTAMAPTSEFECSNGSLETVQHAAEWGLLSNSHAVPTDCPQRDERFGWTGDGRLTARAFQYNFESVRFHRKWLGDHRDAQSEHGYVPDTIPYGFGTIPSDVNWSLTMVLLPWTLYQQYGDRRVLEEHFEPMCRYVDYWHSVDDDGYLPAEYGNYGDWLAFEHKDEDVENIGQPIELFNTATNFRATELVANAAGVLGYTDIERRYRDRADTIAVAFNDAFLDTTAGRYAPETQAAQAVPLFLGIVPEEHVGDVVSSLAGLVEEAGTLQTGFLGTRALLHALTEYGHADLAYEVVSQPNQPGWVYMIDQGATTMWERWDSDQKVGSGMNSLNHSPFTMVSEWFYRGLVGIEPAIGEGQIAVRPAIVDDLDHASATVDTPLGSADVAWERGDDDVELSVTIPWNTDGIVEIPDGYTRLLRDGSVVWTVDEGVRPTAADVIGPVDTGEREVGVTAGEYTFTLE